MGIASVYAPIWNDRIAAALKERPCRVSSAHLLAIGTAAAARGDGLLAYLAAGTGLESARASWRHVSPDSRAEPARVGRGAAKPMPSCRHGTAGVANDVSLIDAISDETRRFFSRGVERQSVHRLGDELIAEIIKNERAAVEFPKSQRNADEYLVTIDDEPQKRSFFGGGGGFPFDLGAGSRDNEGDDDDDDDDDEDDFPFSQFGPGKSPKSDVALDKLPGVKELFERFGTDIPRAKK